MGGFCFVRLRKEISFKPCHFTLGSQIGADSYLLRLYYTILFAICQ